MMIQTGSQMIPLWALLVTLFCGFPAAHGAAIGAAAASKSDCYEKTCVDIEYKIHNAENQLYPGEGLSCCGGKAFNPEEATCCKVEDGRNTTAITEGLSQKVSVCCGLKAYNKLNEMCCQSTVVTKPVPKAECCGTAAYDDNTHLCCGPENSKKISKKTSSDSKCCGRDQFDAKTQYCDNETMTVHSITHCGTTAYNTSRELCCQLTVRDKFSPNAECCDKSAYNDDTHLCCGPENSKKILTKNSNDSKCCGHDQFDAKTQCCDHETMTVHPISTQQQRFAPQPPCTEPDTRVCGSSCYNISHLSCSERNKEKSKGCCATDRGADVAPGVYDPHTHVCCDGCLSKREPPIDPSHGSTKQHCCGTGVYWPHTEICCSGHKHQRKENTHCCGVKAYDIKDTWMKCCAGTLYNLTGRHEAQCCGSLLLTPPNQSVCCSSEDMEVLYAAKTGFRCCGHSYYNATLWSCCAGNLSPVHQLVQHQMIKESRLLSVNNLNETDLCKTMKIGTVQSVSPHSIVFIDVLKINERDATVTAMALPHILQTPDRCSSPKLTPGKTYFFNQVNVFTDFNHESIAQSLHFITSKCKRPVTTAS